MRYPDNRFQNDKIFGFYANDYCQRKMANSNGGVFVNRVCQSFPDTLEDLQNQIRQGDHSFLKQIQYFCGSIKGTDSYWRQKKEELNSWMTYHIEQGNGPPTLYLTLSCAEYWWPDLQKLICQRLFKSSDKKYHVLAKNIQTGDHSSKIKGVNLYMGLVQEFFHLRVKHWLECVGKQCYILNTIGVHLNFQKGVVIFIFI